MTTCADPAGDVTQALSADVPEPPAEVRGEGPGEPELGIDGLSSPALAEIIRLLPSLP